MFEKFEKLNSGIKLSIPAGAGIAKNRQIPAGAGAGTNSGTSLVRTDLW